MVKCIDFCREMVNAAEVDSNTEILAAIWEIVKLCTWDPAILESLGSMRPFESQMKLLVKLMECELCRKLLSPSQLARCRRQSLSSFPDALPNILNKASRESSQSHVLSCELTKFILENFYRFVGVSIDNSALPDPVEVVVRPRDSTHILVVAKYELPLSAGKDETDRTTGVAWSSQVLNTMPGGLESEEMLP